MTKTVTVACKLPHGLILRVFKMVDVEEAQPAGSVRTVPRAQQVGAPVTIKGYLQKYDPSNPPVAVAPSFALTHGVDKEFFEEWLRQNHDHAAVVNNLIFASDKASTVNGRVKEHADQPNGFEPIDRNRLPKRIQNYKKDEAA